jgi:RecJ-like exonuclease
VEPGLLGSKVFYIQDSSAGIQIYFSKEDFPQVKLGDEVSITGKVSEAQNEKKINVSEKADIEVKGQKGAPVPQEIRTGDLEEKHEGQLAQISGEIAKTSGNVFYVDDGSGQAKVYINKNTNIEKPKMEKGDAVTIIGVASETSSGYRVLPRYQTDLKSGDGTTLAGTAMNGIMNLPQAGGGILFFFGFSFIASLYVLIPKIAFMWG